ncbi:LCP family protein [Pseudonocardia phyllosphaerae]|uniref:LCP family protein n=1 Tax=Pseudonocardia phyllosphaerae TaxID=3390502 RepID=UPI00397A4475
MSNRPPGARPGADPTVPFRRAPWPEAPRPRRRWASGLRVAVAVLSAVVLLTSGYAWSVLRQVTGGLGTGSSLAATASPDGATDVLLIGLDSRTDAHGDPLPREVLDRLDAGDDSGTVNTDTIMLLRVPNSPGRPATVVSIPRDSYVPIPGFGTHKINSAYARAAGQARSQLTAQGVTGSALERRVDEAGRTELAATVADLTGVAVDHYAEVNLAGFAQVTEAVGGVPVCLNAPVHDTYSGADFPAGEQMLQGPAALSFVRQRHGLPRGDLDRIVRQQAFLGSLARQVLDAGTLLDPAELGRISDAVGRAVVVDQGWDLVGFGVQAAGTTGGDIAFGTIPTVRDDLRTRGDGTAVEVDPEAVRGYVAGLVDGPAADTAADTAGPGAAAPDATRPAAVDTPVAPAAFATGPGSPAPARAPAQPPSALPCVN